jgi:hypothetical protein
MLSQIEDKLSVDQQRGMNLRPQLLLDLGKRFAVVWSIGQ